MATKTTKGRARLDDAKTARKLIDMAGGDTEFGRLLGMDDDKDFRQRINNWKRRGIPAAIHLEHYNLLQRLHAKSTKTSAAAS